MVGPYLFSKEVRYPDDCPVTKSPPVGGLSGVPPGSHCGSSNGLGGPVQISRRDLKTGANHSQDLEKLGRDYASDMDAIVKSELTDWQKMDAIHSFAKPRLVYALQNQLPSLGWARALDKKVKAMVKLAFKLPKRTIDAFLFAPWRSGGLGLPRVEDEVHVYGVSTAFHLQSLSEDFTVVDVAQAALGATARKRAKGLASTQEFLDKPPQIGEGLQRDIKSLWSRVRVSLQLCQTTINLAGKQISIAGRVYGSSKKHLICSAMRSVLQGHHLGKLKTRAGQLGVCRLMRRATTG